MRVADVWFSALWVLLIPSSLALATAKSSGLFGIPSGGSTAMASRTSLQAAAVDAPAAQISSSEVCGVPALLTPFSDG